MDRQISVLIVDDEMYVREGLRHILDWESLGFTICDEAGNGQEAVEKIRLYQPGIVLMDIRIPGMSGIEVIRTAREDGFQGEFIVLSGYSDFRYAQASIQYGVRDYLVKPVEEEKLTQAVLAAAEKISRMNDREMSLVQYRKKAKSMVLHDVLTGKEFDPYINYRELKLDASLYQVIIYESGIPQLQFIHFADILLPGEQQDLYVEQMRIQDREVILLKNRYPMERFQRWISHYSKGYQKNSFMDSAFFAYGEAVSDIREIHRSYAQCLTLIERRFFCDEKQRALSWLELPKKKGIGQIGEEESRLYSERLAGYLQTHSRNKIDRLLEELKLYLTENDFSILAIRHFLIGIFLEVKHRILKSYGSGAEIPFPKNAAVIETIESMRFLYEILGYFREQSEMIMEHVGNETADSIFDEILYYVQSNYAIPLKLEEIGPMFGYSSSYLGKLFIQKCGCSFKAYLDKLRIDRSKELLVKTDMKIYEIAAMVGYKYVDVFHQKFKKQESLSPADYRKQEREKNR